MQEVTTEKKEFTPNIVAFCCNWCSYAGADLAGSSRLTYPANVKIIRVPCSCRVNPMFVLKSKAQKKAFADAVISGMLQWHSVTNDKFGELTAPTYDSWYEYYKKEKQEPWLKGFRDLANNGKLSKNRLKVLEEATEIFNSLPAEDSKPVLIHADLNIMNIMADPDTLELIAFIDPNGCMWADREYDLYQFHNMWGDVYGLYEAYKEKCPLSPYADFRVAYYGAMHEVSMRLKVGHVIPLWEDLNVRRLKQEMKKIKK